MLNPTSRPPGPKLCREDKAPILDQMLEVRRVRILECWNNVRLEHDASQEEKGSRSGPARRLSWAMCPKITMRDFMSR